MQEGFVAVWRSAGRFVPERAKASTWILTLVHRRAVDQVRRSERRRTEPLDDVPQTIDSGSDTEELAWLHFERERIQLALKKLPDQQREALELAYYGGFTQSSSPRGSASLSVLSRAGCSPVSADCATCCRRPVQRIVNGTRQSRRADSGARPRLALARGRGRARGTPAPLTRGAGAADRAPGGGGVTRVCGRHPAPPPSLRDRILAETKKQEPTNVVPLRRRAVVPALAAVAAAAAGVAIGLGVWGSSLSGSLDDERSAAARQDEVLALFAQQDSSRFPLTGANGTLVVANDGQAGLVLSGFEAAPAGKTYQAWVIEGDKPVPAGLFTAGAANRS